MLRASADGRTTDLGSPPARHRAPLPVASGAPVRSDRTPPGSSASEPGAVCPRVSPGVLRLGRVGLRGAGRLLVHRRHTRHTRRMTMTETGAPQVWVVVEGYNETLSPGSVADTMEGLRCQEFPLDRVEVIL